MTEEPGEASRVTADPVMGDLRIRWLTRSWPLTVAVLAERPMPAQGLPGFVSLTSGRSARGSEGLTTGRGWWGLGLGDCFGGVAGLEAWVGELSGL
jgi:hypothetical protein